VLGLGRVHRSTSTPRPSAIGAGLLGQAVSLSSSAIGLGGGLPNSI
jgi:hypothetical protein